MNTLRFSSNWNNKLRNFTFSTIRKHTNEKHQYYASQLDKTFDVKLKDTHIINAKLVHIARMQYKDIPYELKAMDTGLLEMDEIDELFKKFGITRDTKVLLMLFKREI